MGSKDKDKDKEKDKIVVHVKIHPKVLSVSLLFHLLVILLIKASVAMSTTTGSSSLSLSLSSLGGNRNDVSHGAVHDRHRDPDRVDGVAVAGGDSTKMIVSSCVCGALSCTIRDVTIDTPTLDCHCPNCRRFHVAGFTSYLKAHKDTVSWTETTATNTATTTEINVGNDDASMPASLTTETVKKTFRDSCHEIGGPVDRVYCSICRTKMATTIVPDAVAAVAVTATTEDVDEAKNRDPNSLNSPVDPDTILINLGPIEDDTVPDQIWMNWQHNRKPCQLESKAVWPDAKPTATDDNPESSPPPPEITIKGSCGCGASTYRIRRFGMTPSQMQHCYCRLCRQFSGSAFQTWVPIATQDFEWTSSSVGGQHQAEPHELVQTTEHGARHMCRTCGGVLTIVYHEDNDTIWPAAGGFVDESLPQTEEGMGDYMHRVAHICCIWKQNWYKLPKDGNERINYAC